MRLIRSAFLDILWVTMMGLSLGSCIKAAPSEEVLTDEEPDREELNLPIGEFKLAVEDEGQLVLIDVKFFQNPYRLFLLWSFFKSAPRYIPRGPSTL